MRSEEERKIEEIYAYGEISIDDLKRIREKFKITCSHCASDEIAIMTENDNDGYCETCSSPYARATIKCKKCGQAISIRT